MLIQPYQLDELKFAWCYQVFFRWRTWRRVLVPSLVGLTAESVNPRLEPFQVQLLELSAEAAKAMDAHWRDQQTRLRVVSDKFSFLPDHVHIAVEVDPTVSPAVSVTQLLNASQEYAFENFPETMIRAQAERLWQPSASIRDVYPKALRILPRRGDVLEPNWRLYGIACERASQVRSFR